jgi:carboxyl-terminal processing protease
LKSPRLRHLVGLLLLAGLLLGLDASRPLLVDGRLLVAGSPEETPAEGEPSVLEVFWEAWRIIQQHYLDQSVVSRERLLAGALDGMARLASQQDGAGGNGSGADRSAEPARRLTYAAIRGMVRSLGDPNTVFLEPAERKVAITRFSGHLEGIGACLDQRGGQVVVSGLVEGGPAAQAGLQPGEVLVEIDGRPLVGWPIREVVLGVRGPSGSPISLTTRPVAGAATVERAITRAQIQLISARGRLLEPGIGLLRLVAFTEHTDAETAALLEQLEQAGARALLLDLRGNLGGLLEPAVAVASRFIGSTPIVGQENAQGLFYGYERVADQPLVHWPLVVLIDHQTASAAEVVAMALRDAERARLVGASTYGKGTVQYLFELKDGSGLHLTAARWVGTAGTRLDTSGLLPDVWASTTQTAQQDPAAEQGLALLRQAIESPATTPPAPLGTPADSCSPLSASAA